MGAFVWVMMAIALWHFTVFVPDRFWGGIVGAFLWAIVGAVVFGYVVSGFSFVGRDDIALIHALMAIPGAAIGLGLCWYWGKYREEHPKKRKRRPSGSARAQA